MNKVLIIESISSVSENFAKYFEHKNFEVKTALNGADGISVALEFLPKLIFCDIYLSDLNGLDVLSKLKKSDLTKSTHFIFLTGETSDESIKENIDIEIAHVISDLFFKYTKLVSQSEELTMKSCDFLEEHFSKEELAEKARKSLEIQASDDPNNKLKFDFDFLYPPFNDLESAFEMMQNIDSKE